MARRKTFYELLTDAINHFSEAGYTSQSELEQWVKILRTAANAMLRPPKITENEIRKVLTSTYSRMIVKGSVLKSNPGISKFTIDKLKPSMRRELDRRVLASTNLIKLNRDEAISTTLRRFQGWATSIPVGGSNVVDRRKEKENIRKPLSKMDFLERRVIIDQTHKFAAALNDTVAEGSGAIAAEWHSRWRRIGYDYREDHKERDEQIYAIRNNWAIEKGLMKAGAMGYTDDITKPGEEVFCSCTYTYIYNLDALPSGMLTEKGRMLLASKK